MQALTQSILRTHPIRITRAQKDAFLVDAAAHFSACGYATKIDSSGRLAKNNNLIIGDVDAAKVIFSANYDTPHRMLLPASTIFPNNMRLTILSRLGILLILAFPALWVATLLESLLDLGDLGASIAQLSCFLLLLVLTFFTFKNKTNVNNNTSGLITLIELSSQLASKDRQNIAFVLFDNKDKLFRGSKRFRKKYGRALYGKPIINVDCVGVGDNICVFLPDKASAAATKLYEALDHCRAAFPVGKQLELCALSKHFFPGDHMRFNLGVAVSAFKKPGKLLRLDDTHTSRDRILDVRNIYALVTLLLSLVDRLDYE